MNNQAMIAVDSLSKSFITDRGKVEVLKEVSLNISAGARIAIVGASGAGKTTFMHLLGGLDKPTSGSVTFAGKDIFSYSASELDAFRNRSIGFVFQFHQLLPEFTALENVMMPALIARDSVQDARMKAAEILAAVGLDHRLDHKPGQLSGGEQQRVAIARSLVMSPRLLLADEPTGNLDSATSDEILALLDRLHQKRDLTMVVVTHSEKVATHMDRIVRMVDGRMQGKG
ncbi:MAG: ABC transporter ATP-binding protein [Deltaproteobacteria bacterium]|jgi:lipoprotein-releasing system ATP-binding protein|nr:ABC transporter ATP-binding protein [Deltaproteobacteria bacterium]MDH4008653.1 ABC transporter ATP-binding protein [Desulfuromonadales bacterium]